jgi:UDP-glucose 4-epimerase
MMDVIRAAQRATGSAIETVYRPPAREAHTLIANPARAGEILGWKPERSSIDRILADAWSASRV